MCRKFFGQIDFFSFHCSFFINTTKTFTIHLTLLWCCWWLRLCSCDHVTQNFYTPQTSTPTPITTTSGIERCDFSIKRMCYLPGQFAIVVDKNFYEKFVDADGVPIMGSTEVDDHNLMNFGKLIKKIMGSLLAEVRSAVVDRRLRIAVVGRRESFCDIPEISYNYYLSPGKPCSNPSAHGVTFKNLIVVTESDGTTVCDFHKNSKSGRVLMHEFAHAVNFAVDERVDYVKTLLDFAYENAKTQGLLEGLRETDRSRAHYFTWGFLTFLGANECNPNSDLYRDRICTKEEMKSFDLDLYNLIDLLLPYINWTYTCADVCDKDHISHLPCRRKSKCDHVPGTCGGCAKSVGQFKICTCMLGRKCSVKYPMCKEYC